VDRVPKALANKEPDRIPIHEFFWTSFVKDFHLDDPADDRRFAAVIDDHVNCVGDDRVEHISSTFMERVKSASMDFAVFGTVIACRRCGQVMCSGPEERD